MARTKTLGTRVPNPVLVAADAHNAAQGVAADQATREEHALARTHTIHLTTSQREGVGICDAALGRGFVQVVATLDHPAMCAACLEQRARYLREMRPTENEPNLRTGYQPVMSSR